MEIRYTLTTTNACFRDSFKDVLHGFLLSQEWPAFLLTGVTIGDARYRINRAMCELLCHILTIGRLPAAWRVLPFPG